MLQKDPLELLSNQIMTVMLHEACHKFGDDRSAEFSYALCDALNCVGYQNFAQIEQELYNELFQGSKAISIDELLSAREEVVAIFREANSIGGAGLYQFNENSSAKSLQYNAEGKQNVPEAERKTDLPYPDTVFSKEDFGKERVIKGFAFTVDTTGKFHIGFGNDLDPTTGLHEFAHSYERMLMVSAESDHKKLALYHALSNWLGATPFEWSNEHRERFVQGFLTMIYNGVSRSGAAGEAYAEMQRIVTEVWNNMSENPALELDAKTKALYDVIFGVQDIQDVLPEEVERIAEITKNQALPNETRGSPTLIDPFLSNGHQYNYSPGSSYGKYNIVYRGDGRPVFFTVVDHGDYIAVDGLNCHSTEEVNTRVAQIVKSHALTDLSNLSFQVEKGAESTMNKAKKDHLDFEKQVINHTRQLINSLREKFDLDALRNSLINVINDKLIVSLGLDPQEPVNGVQKYHKYIETLTGQNKLNKCTTLQLMQALEMLEPGSSKAYFDTSFFRIIPTLIERLQAEFNDYSDAGEEEMFRMIGRLMNKNSGQVTQSSQKTLIGLRMANVLISKMGVEGKNVLELAATGQNRSERMAGYGSNLIHQIKEIFLNHKGVNKLQDVYMEEHQIIAGDIIAKSMEADFESEVLGIPKQKVQAKHDLTDEQKAEVSAKRDAFIRDLVQENNRKYKAWKPDDTDYKNPYRILHPDDVIAVKNLMVEFSDYYASQIEELNARMGRTAIGLRSNYIMSVLTGISSTEASGLVEETRGGKNVGELLGEPPWVKKYEGAEGARDTNFVPLLNAYNASMSRYIAFYELTHHINNVLPLKVSQTFNTGYENILYNFVKGIIGYAPKQVHLDKYISLTRTNVTSAALAWKSRMIALNYLQRYLSGMFVNKEVINATNKIVNPFSGKLRNTEKYPNLEAAIALLRTGGENLYEEAIRKSRSLDTDDELNIALRAYAAQTRVSEWWLENSGFLYAERGNWCYAYTAGVLQAVMSSKDFVDAMKDSNVGGVMDAVEKALENPDVLRRALVSGMIVNASTNCDPSAVFSPQVFTNNNVMKNLLWFLRFSVNYAEIALIDANPFITNMNNFSQGIFRSIVYGDGDQAEVANQLMVMNNIVKMFSPANMNVVFNKKGGVDYINNRFGKKDMARAHKVAKQVQSELSKHMNEPQHGYFKLSGGRMVAGTLSKFLMYILAEFLVEYFMRMAKKATFKHVGRRLFPKKVAERKMREMEKDEVLAPLIDTTVGMLSPNTSIASGLILNVNPFSMTSKKSWGRALMGMFVNLVSPIGASASVWESITGSSMLDVAVEAAFQEEKNKNSKGTPKRSNTRGSGRRGGR